jgi:hypothetical protein
MLTLFYYSPGAGSLAPHLALEESGATSGLQLVSNSVLRNHIEGKATIIIIRSMR